MAGPLHVLLQVRLDQMFIVEGDSLKIDPQHKPPGLSDTVREALETLATSYLFKDGHIAVTKVSNHGTDPEISTNGGGRPVPSDIQ